MTDTNRNADGPQSLRRLLEEAIAILRHDQELAEARLEGLNRQLRELHRTGLVGAVVGVLLWNTFEIIEVEADPRQFGPEAARRHVPFEECEPAVKALLAPHAAALVHNLLIMIRLSNRR